MEFIKYIIIGFLVLYVISRILSGKGVNNITAHEVKPKLKNKNIQFIDVRTTDEYQNGHVKQFKNMPLHLLKKQVNQLKKDQETVIICGSGNRSLKAYRILKKEGFNNLTNVRGGINGWVD